MTMVQATKEQTEKELRLISEREAKGRDIKRQRKHNQKICLKYLKIIEECESNIKKYKDVMHKPLGQAISNIAEGYYNTDEVVSFIGECQVMINNFQKRRDMAVEWILDSLEKIDNSYNC